MNSHQKETKYLILGIIDISSLLNVREKFEEFRLHLTTEQEKAGAVQAFEFCYELCWKMLKRVLEAKGLAVQSPRDTFRLGASNGYIDDPEVWFDFLSKTNLTSHVYDRDIMLKVVKVFEPFFCEMKKLIERMQATA